MTARWMPLLFLLAMGAAPDDPARLVDALGAPDAVAEHQAIKRLVEMGDPAGARSGEGRRVGAGDSPPD